MEKTANVLILTATLVIAICWYLTPTDNHEPVLIISTVIIAFLALVFLVNRQHLFSSHGCGIAGLAAYSAAITGFRITAQSINTLVSTPVIAASIMLGVGLAAAIVIVVTLGSDWLQARRKKKKLPVMPMELDHPPMVSIHLPIYEEPPQLVVETIDALNRVHYPDFEIIVVDHGSPESFWKPVRQYCQDMGSHVHFYHQPEPGGLRARALNLALEHTHHKAQLIAVIPAGTQVDTQILHDLVPQFQIETVAIVHASQRFRDAEQNLFKAICSTEYRDIFHAGLKTRDRHDMILHYGKISLIRRALLEETGGWD